MILLYNSDSFAVMQIGSPSAIDGPAAGDGDSRPASPAGGTEPKAGGTALTRGGYEIVDKFARKEIFLEGALAQRFRAGVEALNAQGPDAEAIEEFIGGFAACAQQPVTLH